MLTIKQKNTLDSVLLLLGMYCSAIFIFEMPRAVFWSPVFLLAGFIFYQLIKGEKIHINLSAVFLILYSFFFILFTYSTRSPFFYQVYIFFHSVIMYLWAYNFFVERSEVQRKKMLELFLTVASVCYIIYAVITLVFYYKCTDAALEARQYYSFWYATTVKPATVLSMSMVIPMTLGIHFLFFGKCVKKAIGALFLLFSVLLNVQTSTRTLLFVCPVVIGLEFIAWLGFVKGKKKPAGILGGVAVTFGVAFLLSYKKLFAYLAEKLEGKLIARVFQSGLSSPSRALYNRTCLQNFSFTYLGGGKTSLEVGTPHNIWLYVYDMGGIVPFIFLILFTLVLAVNFVMLIRNKNVTTEYKFLLFIVQSVMLVEFFLEPFIYPLPSFYLMCFFMFGLTARAAVEGRTKNCFLS